MRAHRTLTGPPMFNSAAIPIFLYGLAIIRGLIVFYVVVSVAVERLLGCLAGLPDHQFDRRLFRTPALALGRVLMNVPFEGEAETAGLDRYGRRLTLRGS